MDARKSQFLSNSSARVDVAAICVIISLLRSINKLNYYYYYYYYYYLHYYFTMFVIEHYHYGRETLQGMNVEVGVLFPQTIPLPLLRINLKVNSANIYTLYKHQKTSTKRRRQLSIVL